MMRNRPLAVRAIDFFRAWSYHMEVLLAGLPRDTELNRMKPIPIPAGAREVVSKKHVFRVAPETVVRDLVMAYLFLSQRDVMTVTSEMLTGETIDQGIDMAKYLRFPIQCSVMLPLDFISHSDPVGKIFKEELSRDGESPLGRSCWKLMKLLPVYSFASKVRREPRMLAMADLPILRMRYIDYVLRRALQDRTMSRSCPDIGDILLGYWDRSPNMNSRLLRDLLSIVCDPVIAKKTRFDVRAWNKAIGCFRLATDKRELSYLIRVLQLSLPSMGKSVILDSDFLKKCLSIDCYEVTLPFFHDLSTSQKKVAQEYFLSSLGSSNCAACCALLEHTKGSDDGELLDFCVRRLRTSEIDQNFVAVLGLFQCCSITSRRFDEKLSLASKFVVLAFSELN
jgi:hypothetical protein